MSTVFTYFAETDTASGGIFEALGIEWKILLFQIIAFVILVILLGKFVYPRLMKSIDERQANIEAASKAATQAQAAAADTQADIEKLLKKARHEAAEIVATAKLESQATVSEAEEKAIKRTEQIVADAHADIANEIIAAKTALHNETLELIASVAEKVIAKKLDSATDQALIVDALKAVK